MKCSRYVNSMASHWITPKMVALTNYELRLHMQHSSHALEQKSKLASIKSCSCSVSVILKIYLCHLKEQ